MFFQFLKVWSSSLALVAMMFFMPLSLAAELHHDHFEDHFQNGLADHSKCNTVVDEDGWTLFVLGVPEVEGLFEAPSDTDGPELSSQAIPPPPAYHSRPGASHTIYLDFDGHTTTGTSWNVLFNSGNDIVTPAYSVDSDTSSFSASELARIEEIWRRVAEDYASFDVNVTTEEPGAANLSREGSGDTQWGIRVVIGGSASDWYGSAGGVAYIGSFNAPSDIPVFVFENNLGNGNSKYTAEATSHEIGHAVGLSHDGVTGGSSYYTGYGSGETGWAPIMGVGYYKNHTTFDNGSYTNANNTQDDLAIITGSNGFGYRPDDHGNDSSGATPLSVQTTSVSGSGLIEQGSDVDVFSFSTGAGAISLATQVVSDGPNLDLSIDLRDSDGGLVQSVSPTDDLDASIATTVAAGTYYLRVQSSGGYGYLGAYSISGTIIDTGSSDLLAPTASSGSIPNVSSAGATSYSFSVTYMDNVAVDVSTVNTGDIRVTGPNSFDQVASFVSLDTSGNGSPRTATYSISPPGGSWDSADNGSYSVVMQANEVRDTSANAVGAGAIGTFSVSAPQPDSVVPTVAENDIPDISAAGGNTYTFRVTYSDNVAVDISTINSGDIRVSGPNSYNNVAILVSVDNTSNGSPRVATYYVNTPGGGWDHSDNGTYTVSMQSSQVSDTSSNAVAAGVIGTFVVSAPLPKYRISGTVLIGSDPLSGVTIDGGSIGSTTTDANGQYSFTEIDKDTEYTLRASLDDYEFLPASHSGTLTADSSHDFSATLQRDDPFTSDRDNDGVSDGQEELDGSDPDDSGSGQAVIGTEVCSEWNGFLSMLNIIEFVNLGSQSLRVQTTLYDISGAAQGNVEFDIAPGAQFDLLVHDMQGAQRDSYGRICARHSGNAGELDGRMVYYRFAPGGSGLASEIAFAFSIPFLPPRSGPQYVSFNTFQPSLAEADIDNIVANWIQLSNFSTGTQSGELIVYAMDGTVLDRRNVEIPGSARRDFAAHAFGRNIVGMIKWQPADSEAKFQMRNVRYYYNNSTGELRFDTAYQLVAQRGNGRLLSTPLDTRGASAVLEISNTLAEEVDVVVNIYSSAGSLVHTEDFTLGAHGSRHVISDSYLNGELGIATIKGAKAGSLIGTAMHYGRDNDRSIRYIYGIPAGEALGSVLRGSYNTFLNQSCDLLLVNPGSTERTVNVSMTRSDGVDVGGSANALLGSELTVPAQGLLELDLCAQEQANNYGVVTVQSTTTSVYGVVVRKGAIDNYRFSTPIRR